VQIACQVCGEPFTPTCTRNIICPKVTCKKQAVRANYLKYLDAHPNAHRDGSRKYRALHGYTEPWPAKRAMGIEINTLKTETPCTDCGSRFPPECMDFDHLDGEVKLNNAGTMVAHGYSRESIMSEIAKCEIVCSNCHRIRTRKRRLKNGEGAEDCPVIIEEIV